MLWFAMSACLLVVQHCASLLHCDLHECKSIVTARAGDSNYHFLTRMLTSGCFGGTSRTYLAHHELESVLVIITIISCPQSPSPCECRSELEGSSPEPADSRPLSPSLEANGNPSPASQMPQAALQHPSHQIPIQSAEGPEAPEVPHSPFEQMSNGTAVGQMPSQPMSIPSPSQQPAILQSPVSSSAPADSRQHVHHWAGLSRQGNDNASAHQLPQASPAGQHEQAASSTVATAGKGSQPAPRHSALHASSSSKGRSDGRADGGHSIRWNDSQDSLWSSQEDLAQLVPDRASKDGVEQSPEAVSFTGQQIWYLQCLHLGRYY